MTAADRLDEIEARADAATTAPWSHCLDELRNRTAVHRIGSSEVNTDVAFTYRNRDGRGPGMQDAEFIAHARTDVPWLIEQVRKRDTALRAVLDLHQPFPGCGDGRCDECEPVGCGTCDTDVTCPTVRAVEAALGEVAS